MPKILVIAHRDRLQERSRFFLDPDLSSEEIEAIETKVEEMGYSALIEGLGGLGTYPSMVVVSSPQNTIEVIVHEWIHNYIFFTPLGRTKKTTEQRTIEETIASILDKEIAAKVWSEYYEPFLREPFVENTNSDSSEQDNRIDFGQAMREIRLQVERYLSEGRVEEAEKYMSEKRDWLEKEGHYIRKLNQAYLTFHGFYATGEAYKDANQGIGSKLLDFRSCTPSLKEFLYRVTKIQNIEDLEGRLKKCS